MLAVADLVPPGAPDMWKRLPLSPRKDFTWLEMCWLGVELGKNTGLSDPNPSTPSHHRSITRYPTTSSHRHPVTHHPSPAIPSPTISSLPAPLQPHSVAALQAVPHPTADVQLPAGVALMHQR